MATNPTQSTPLRVAEKPAPLCDLITVELADLRALRWRLLSPRARLLAQIDEAERRLLRLSQVVRSGAIPRRR